MKTISRNQNIPIEKIFPHPDNPRKDVGDVAELAESIKASGIFQNLTVVVGGKGAGIDGVCGGYTVIIGHRRLAAAKQAGLTEVPCMVAEMDEREQVATMLLENMQRSDLTIYEQAQGFQMMLDLGETQEDIAKKTGLSKTTVRHRLKLLELDPEELRKAEERQATISDYIELEKISDPELKNKALKEIGTSNFEWTVKNAVRECKERKYAQEWIAFLSGIAKKIEPQERVNRKMLKSLYIRKPITDVEKKAIAEFGEGHDYYYSIENRDSWACIVGELNVEPSELEENAKKLKEQKINEKRQKIHDLESMMADSRGEFVESFTNRQYISDITSIFLSEPHLDDIDYEKVAEILNIEYDEVENNWNPVADITASEDYEDYAEFNPHILMLAMLYTIYEGGRNASITDYTGLHYSHNRRLERWYEILKKVGYKMSATEKSLLNGTHKCFEDDCEE